MNHQNESLLDAFRREPRLTAWLLRIGLVVPVLLFGWSIAGPMALDAILVSAISMLLTLLYGCALAVIIVRIMYASGRWQVDSSTAMQWLKSNLRPGADDAAAPAAVSSNPGAAATASSFHETHFLLLVKEEVNAARRAGDELSVVWLDVSVPVGEPAPAQLDRMSAEIAGLLSGQAKTIGQSLNVSQSQYAFSLPHHGPTTARAFMSKVVQALGSYWCHCGIASYPRDESSAEALLNRARQLCQESREDRQPGSSPARVA